MSNYIATIRHSSIARARQINITGNLAKAKAAATREFGLEQLGYAIVILDEAAEVVATKLVGDARWSTDEDRS